MTDPNFLHSGDHVPLGPGVTSNRLTDPAVELEELPGIDAVLLSHYHEYLPSSLHSKSAQSNSGSGTTLTARSKKS